MPDDIQAMAAGIPEDPNAPAADYGKPQPEYEEYSVGGWTKDGRSIGQEGFYTLEEAQEYSQHMKETARGVMGMDIYGWKNGKSYQIENEGWSR